MIDSQKSCKGNLTVNTQLDCQRTGWNRSHFPVRSWWVNRTYQSMIRWWGS